MTLSNSVEPFTPKRNVIQLVFNKLELLSSEQATQLQIYGRLSATANLQRDRFPRYTVVSPNKRTLKFCEIGSNKGFFPLFM